MSALMSPTPSTPLKHANSLTLGLQGVVKELYNTHSIYWRLLMWP